MEFEVDINTVIDIYTELCERFDDGEAGPDSLNEYELTIYVTQTLESEVNNGGFIQFFDNAGGAFADEIVPAFKRIGARKTASICKKALQALGQGLPKDWEERRALLDRIVDDRVGELLEACDEAFYEYPDDLEAECGLRAKERKALRFDDMRIQNAVMAS